MACDLAFVVEDVLQHRHGDDFFVEPAGGLRRSRPLLAFEREQILRFAAHAISGGDEIGDLDHRRVNPWLVRLQSDVAEMDAIAMGLHQADRLNAADDADRNAIHHHPPRGSGDGFQAGGAKPADH